MSPKNLLKILLLGVSFLLSACGSDGADNNGSPEPVSIAMQPYNQTVVNGTAATFAVVATGATSYQWTISTDGGLSYESIPDAISSVYILDPVTIDMDGVRYRVTVTGATDTVVSTYATLTVVMQPQPPEIVAQPVPVNVTAPNLAMFSVASSGTNLSYQWQMCSCSPSYDSNGVDITPWQDISGATLATLLIDSTDISMDGAHYRVIVSNEYGIVQSDPAVLNVILPPFSIVTHPYNQTVLSGATAIFAVVAEGAMSYQWVMSNDGWSSYEAIIDATSPVLILDPATMDMNGVQFRVAMTGASGTLVSTAATLTVVTLPQLPEIVVQPVPAVVTAPDAATYSVTATGTNLSYQWQFCLCTPVYDTNGEDISPWENIPNETLATLVIPATDPAMDGGHVRVLVSNMIGTVSSVPVPLLVTSPPSPPPVIITMPPEIMTQPQWVTVVENSSASFTVEFTGSYDGIPEPVVSWEYSTDGGSSWQNINDSGNSIWNINSVSSNTLTVATTNLAMSGNLYRVVIANDLGEVTSEFAGLTVITPGPIFLFDPYSQTVNEGQNVQFTVDVSSTSVPTFQWQISMDGGANWANIDGATSNAYSITNVNSSMSGYLYRCVATDNEGSRASGTALLNVNQAPVAVDDAVSTNGTYAVDILMSDLLANDTDPNQDYIFVSSAGNCTGCSVQIDVYSSSLIVVIDQSYVGTASFEYTVTDGMLTSVGLVTITGFPQ